MSRGKGVVQAKEDISHLTKIDHFARWSFLLYINCINIYTLCDRTLVYLIITVYFPSMLLEFQAQLMIKINSQSKRSRV